MEKDRSATIHRRNRQELAIEIYNLSKCLLPLLMTELFKPRNEHLYNLKSVYQFHTSSVNTAYHGIEIMSFLGPNLWNILSNKLKNIESLKAFKNRIKDWKPGNCPYGIFKALISNAGFIWRKKFGLSLPKDLSFHVFLGYCIIKDFLVLLNFNLLCVILI